VMPERAADSPARIVDNPTGATTCPYSVEV